jgi:DNA-binding NtrC family response regulator
MMVENKSILVVDDEKNIRTTLQQVLEASGYAVTTAVNGEDCLAKLSETGFDMVLLDMKLPGIDGIEVLREVRRKGYDVPVAMITAYGTIESAVEAMKLGAVDYLRKPFSPEQIRELVGKILARPNLKEEEMQTYEQVLEYAKFLINKRELTKAGEYLQKAVGIDSSRAEGFNLLGVIFELRGDRLEAQKRYRAAIGLDPIYEPACVNLERTTKSDYSLEGIDKGASEDKKEEK